MYRQVGCIDRLDVSTGWMYRQVGCIDRLDICRCCQYSNLMVDSCEPHRILQTYRETSFRQFGYIDRPSRVDCGCSRNFNPSKCCVMWMTRKNTSDPEGLHFERGNLEERRIIHLPVYRALTSLTIRTLRRYVTQGTRHVLCRDTSSPIPIKQSRQRTSEATVGVCC